MDAAERVTAAEFQRRAGRTGNKYGACPKVYRGKKYHSTGEADYAQRLDLDPDVIAWGRQVGFHLGEDWYCIVDFVVWRVGGVVQVVEFKGAETGRFLTTKRLWSKYAHIQMVIVRRERSGKFYVSEIVEPREL